MKLLTRPQQTAIIMLADQAYAHQVNEGFHTPRGDMAKTRDQSDWRHTVQRKCTGHDSLTMCVNEHFEHLMRDFSLLAGRDAEAFEWGMKCGPLPDAAPEAPATKHELPDSLHNRSLWAFKIKTLCISMRVNFPAYPLGILKRQNPAAPKSSIEAYSAQAIRKSFFSLNFKAQRTAKALTQAEADADCPF